MDLNKLYKLAQNFKKDAQTFNPKDLQQKLLNRLYAVVPSYVQGTYNSYDMNVSVDMVNKKIFATVKLPKMTSAEVQKKIEDNFKQFAYALLPKEMQAGFVVGMSFVSKQ